MSDVAGRNSNRGSTKKWAWFFVALGFIAACFGIKVAVVEKGGLNTTTLGALGGFLQGSTASLWSLAGLLFIYETLRGQELQNEHHRVEKMSDDEVRIRQDFESAFFHLLTFQNQIAEGMYTEVPNFRQVLDVKHGRTCFVFWYYELKKRVEDELSEDEIVQINKMCDIYKEFYFTNQANLGHYFRTLYHVIKFCHESGLEPQQIRRFTSLARAQLSAGELTMLFYNGISPVGVKLKPLIEKYGLLEHLDLELLLHPSHKQFYAASAYV